MMKRKSASAGRGWVGSAAAILLAAGAMLWGGVSKPAAGSPGLTAAVRVENPSAAQTAHFANADRDVLELQLD